MAQASTADESRERAASSEPCSTRPNPFDDSDISSRKRRRTSLSGASRSRSVDTVNSSPDSLVAGGLGSEAKSDSAMKIDPEPATPTTPEQQQQQQQQTQPPQPHPAPGPRSSRVTINVRTPSRPLLEAIPSSPPSPSPQGPASAPLPPADAAKLSLEDSEVDMSREEDTIVGTPVSSGSSSGSPPVEIVSVQPPDFEDDDIDAIPQDVTLGDDDYRLPLEDPTGAFPYHDITETYPDTVARLTQYLVTHLDETVAAGLVDWIKKFLTYARTAEYEWVLESYTEYRSLWNCVPDIVMFMVNRKVPYPRNRGLRHDIFNFYKYFAMLTAYFMEWDLKTLQDIPEGYTGPIDTASGPYIHALGALTRKDEIVLYGGTLHNGDDELNFGAEMMEVLEAFQGYHRTAGGSLVLAKQLAELFSEIVARFPKLMDFMGHLGVLTSNILAMSYRKAMTSNQQAIVDTARGNISRGYSIFKILSGVLASVIEKHVNHLSHESASNLLPSLTEIYQTCLSTDGVVPDYVVNEHLQKHPPIATESVPEAMAFHWKFVSFTKLIMSSQMQLRVFAVTGMCNDLVTFYRKFTPSDDPTNAAFLNYIANFLLKTGLVAYILGPKCHPEITIESSNIIGFLVVSTTYTSEHTDALWQTVTSTQDPRVSDALIKMTVRIVGLYHTKDLLYLCEKLSTVPVESFTLPMREFCQEILRALPSKTGFNQIIADPAPYDLCIRLIRQSSTFGPQSQIAYPDLQQFAIQRFKDLLASGPSPEGRMKIYLDCVADIAQRSPTTFGSIWVLYLLTLVTPRPQFSRDLHTLTSEHDLTKLLVDELEAAIIAARRAGFHSVLHGSQNTPRRELLMFTVCHESSTITKPLGLKLWHLLVGSGALCREDRDVGWLLLNTSLKRSAGGSPFTSTCFSEYLPTLLPECFCTGALDFVREGVIPLVNDATSILLDDDDNIDRAGIEQLWRMILTAPEGTIEQQAINTLVNDVYVDSRSILSFPHYRARKVHLALVGRCLRQLSSAAAKLKGSGDGAASGDDDSMVIIANDTQTGEQELMFIRSLSVLREFHRLHQASAHFSAPDLRALILDPPKIVEGDSAELKYQSFDGDMQTEVKPLNIGKRNTAASLLASLREATGFNNYRIYYRGRPFVPQENEICKSLEDLQIHNGIILVKRESDTPTSPTRVRPGASPVDVEILGHFEELWEYLSMEEKLAREIYSFLVKLPADENILKVIENSSTHSQASHQMLFPLGQAFKSLYAVHALREYLGTEQRKYLPSRREQHGADSEAPPHRYAAALLRAMLLVVSAISDEEVIAQCPSSGLQIELSSSLVECFVALLKDPFLPTSTAQLLDASLLGRLLAILSAAVSATPSDSTIRHVSYCFKSILESCCLSAVFMEAFCSHTRVPALLNDLLLCDPRPTVRHNTALLINEKVANHVADDMTTAKFRDFFWPLVSGLVGPAINRASNSTEALDLCYQMFVALRDARPQILDIQILWDEWIDLLLHYTTFEDVTQPDVVDLNASNLIRLLHSIIAGSGQPREIRSTRNLARTIFWRHLFPPFETGGQRVVEPHRPIIHPQSRMMLIQIIFGLIDDDPVQSKWLLEDLNELVPVGVDEEDFYAYDLPQQFERAKAVRAPCGYVGLRNLSNTCYLNSLFTQLFMNVDFRRFMLNADVQDRHYSQGLLFQTQKLFGYMQGSIRRFMNPDDCVSAIKTYDDTQIDIHNQMDVDEFYNLLFDRWEGQLLTSEEKHQFRSFYGGQLVQQVTSKECEHISERLEPFSAIQCDIKGKNSLEESLQAYVDGEIMEGDNKYKCSTCDRHVDAVKRACLKDVPDNLIFHLKRFDFNLRTLQRSKINDYFSFPSKVDMRPYTIEHLSNPAEDMSEDIFELVGVLVHSGTAESGHYYSYIRERPSRSDAPVWVEFNDDAVATWDPAMLESSCFGGPDYRSQFDNGNVIYDKTYSAYMLFYQRSSSLAKGQELLRRPGRTTPLRVELPSEIGRQCQLENEVLLRRHCLYDPYQMEFVKLAVQHMKTINKQQCTAGHDTESLAITMTLSYLDQVASRTKDAPDFMGLANYIDMMCQTCVHCSHAALEYLHRYSEATRMLIQRNTDAEIRQATVNLLLRILQVIKAETPLQYGLPPDDEDDEDEEDFDPYDTSIASVMNIIRVLWENFHVQLRSWNEVFDFMLQFVNMGRHEIAAFLSTQYLRFLLLVIYADTGLDLPPQFARLATTVSRRTPTRPPSYDRIIGLLDVLLAKMRFGLTERGEPVLLDHPETRVSQAGDDNRFLLTKPEARILHSEWTRGQSNIFVDKLIGINQNIPSTHRIIGTLITESRSMEDRIFRTLRNGITGQIAQHNVAAFLRVGALVFCRTAKDMNLVNGLISHVCQQCMALQNAEGKAFLDFQRDVFDAEKTGSGQTAADSMMTGLDNIPEWAPGLLGYFDSVVTGDVEAFLHSKVFRFTGASGFGDSETAKQRTAKMNHAGKMLGIKCLGYLQDNYVSRHIDVSTRLVAPLERVIKECRKYFNLEEPAEDELTAEFMRLNQSKLES
ncbi:hypothetical protein B0H63DRAFT_268265 [Podospora didyma]|uniref:USP domain-containing protein n=1 Tax=Podospora didyma TaxID=330526 RepID=A0AAE0N8W2_9PEZI|nr:hypothetical protein B0H63DRAFT_268265 [Podospora didyma]